MIENAIKTILFTQANEVYANQIPESATYPALSYLVVNDKPNTTIDATGGDVASVQISAVSTSLTQTTALAKQLRRDLPKIKGEFGGVIIKNIIYKNVIPDFSGDPDVHRKIIDFNFYYGDTP